jgi:hypothetical protein
VGYNGIGQSCFSYSQKSLKTYDTLAAGGAGVSGPDFAHAAGDNIVLVYFFETPERDPRSPGIFMYSYQKVNGRAGRNLVVNDGVFQQYIIPTTP